MATKTDSAEKPFKCGQCGETKHTLTQCENGEIHVHCVKCKNISNISITKSLLRIENVKGFGVLCIF